MDKPCVEFNTQERIKPEKIGDKDIKALYKLMKNAVYDKKWKIWEIELM